MSTLVVERQGHLKDLMKQEGIDTCIFFHYTDISYFTASSLGNFLVIPQEGPTMLFTRKAFQKTKSYNTHISVVSYRSYKDLQATLSHLSNQTLSTPMGRVDYATLTYFLNSFSLSPSQITDTETILNKLTKRKSPQEIDAMKRANQDIADILLSLSADFLLHKEEWEISAHLYKELRRRKFVGDYFFRRPLPFVGVEVLTKDSIYSPSNADVTYSGNGLSPILAAGSGKNRIQENVPFVIDIMQNSEGIHADVTRTFVVGEPSARLLSRYHDLLEIQNTLLSACRVGTHMSEVYNKGLVMAIKLGYEKNFMGLFPEQAKFVGHNLGAWVDEFPPFAAKVDIPLESGMTFAMEPKLYFEDFDSPGIESNYLQTVDGPQSLTPLSDNLIIL